MCAGHPRCVFNKGLQVKGLRRWVDGACVPPHCAIARPGGQARADAQGWSHQAAAMPSAPGHVHPTSGAIQYGVPTGLVAAGRPPCPSASSSTSCWFVTRGEGIKGGGGGGGGSVSAASRPHVPAAAAPAAAAAAARPPNHHHRTTTTTTTTPPLPPPQSLPAAAAAASPSPFHLCRHPKVCQQQQQRPARPPLTFAATPKSASLTRPSLVVRMLAPLMSRCTTPCACRYASPCAREWTREKGGWAAAAGGWLCAVMFL